MDGVKPVAVLDDPKRMMAVHGWLAALWLALAVGTTAWAFYDPESRYLLAWLVFMSAYANAGAHWSARQGAAPSAED